MELVPGESWFRQGIARPPSRSSLEGYLTSLHLGDGFGECMIS
jgi:hypothetical protein